MEQRLDKPYEKLTTTVNCASWGYENPGMAFKDVDALKTFLVESEKKKSPEKKEYAHINLREKRKFG